MTATAPETTEESAVASPRARRSQSADGANAGDGAAGTGAAEGAGATSPSPSPSRRDRLRAWLAGSLVIVGGTLICKLPDRIVWHLADIAGSVAYTVSGDRRDRARLNLRRVVVWMAAHEVGDEKYRRAADDPRILEKLVRSAFHSLAHYYMEVLRTPRFTAAYVNERIVLDTVAEVDQALGTRRALILVGMHFGSIEMPGLFAMSRVGDITTAMETLRNERIQRYLYRIRVSYGLRIVGLKEAGTELIGALRRNEPIGLIADRDITGGGIEVQMFGATTKIPAGPVLLASETGAPLYVSGVRRVGPGRYRGKLWPVPVPPLGSRRERSRAMLQEEAKLFERVVVDAPDQWLACFHQIWPDLERPARKDSGGNR
jgi:KDO2-lipid IV(A) lauroyltransferase